MGMGPDLYNHNVVYILGAGASVDAGMPVVANFLNRMRDALDWLDDQDGREREQRAIQNVLAFRHEIASAAYRVQVDPENIEELFSLAAASESNGLMDDVKIAIASTLDYSAGFRAAHGKVGVPRNSGPSWTAPPSWQHVADEQPTQTIAATMRGPMPINAPQQPIVIIDRSLSELTYAFLTGRVWADDPRRRITIITFNYDLVIETALTALGIDWNYGTIDANDEKRPSHERCVKLLKLHGSINWARPSGSDNPRSQIPDTRLLKDYETYRDLLGARYVPLIVPPTWQKNFDGALAFVWDDAVKALTDATRIGILGFSIPASDGHFKYLIAAGLRNNISLRRVVFATKDPEGPAERLFAIFRSELDGSLVRVLKQEIASYAIGGTCSELLNERPDELIARASIE